MKKLEQALESKVLHITSEEMLTEVRELLERKGLPIDEYDFYTGLLPGDTHNYLYFIRDFGLAYKDDTDTELTLTEFKQIIESV